MNILIDTSVLIAYKRKLNEDLLLLKEFALQNNAVLCLSTLVVFEFFAGKEIENIKRFNEAKETISFFSLLNIDRNTSLKAAELFRKSKIVLPVVDLLIAASAIVQHGEVATYNIKHFKHIPEVKLFDWKRIREK